jgi:hypothetical protein
VRGPPLHGTETLGRDEGFAAFRQDHL